MLANSGALRKPEMQTADPKVCRSEKVEPNSTLRPMLDNAAMQAIIGQVDGRLRLVRHSGFCELCRKVRGNHRQANEPRADYSNYRATF